MSARGARAQVYGLQLTTIAKGAFLIRASIVFTPILSTIAGDVVPRGLWAGALLGFAGAPMPRRGRRSSQAALRAAF